MEKRSTAPGRRSERGQAMFLIVFAVLGLIGVVALAVDGGLAYADRRQAQNAADSAALAASFARIEGGNYASAALTSAERNGFDNDGQRDIVSIHSPPVSGPYAGNDEYIQVVITSHMPTYFGRVVGVDTVTNTVQAVTRAKPAEWGPILDGYAVISLTPASDCQDFKSFWVHGEATLDLQGGGIFVNSNNRACAFMQQGNGSVVMEDESPFNIVGGASIQKVQLIQRVAYPVSIAKPTRDDAVGIPFFPTTGASPVSYPPPFNMPKPGCGPKVAEISEDGKTLSPGNWEEDFPPDGVTHLEKGIYCINGDVNIRGNTTIEGNNVLLYVEHGSVHFNGDATIQLGAPTSGPFKGLLMFLPMDNHNRVVLNGDSKSTIRGTILAPASLIRITGNDSSYGFHSQIIGYQIELDGNSLLIVKYIDDQNYDALNNPEVQISQ